MKIIYLAINDLKQLLTDWKSVVFLLAMPIAFTLMFGFIFGGMGSGDVDSRLPVGILDQDNGSLSSYLLGLLEDSEVIRLVYNEETSLETLREQVGDGDLAGVVVIPAGYSRAMLEGEPIQLILILESGAATSITIQSDVQVAAARLNSTVLTAQLSVQAYERQQVFADQAARQKYFDTSLERAFAAWSDPPVQTKITQTGQPLEENSADEVFGDNPYAHPSPGMLLQFTIAGLMGAAEVLVNERKSRSLARLLTTSISRAEILLGHYLTMFIMVFTQVFLLMAFGQVFLGLDYLAFPIASLVMALSIAISIAALGLLIGALAKTTDKAMMFSMIPMFLFSGLGGAWMPLEFTSKTVQTIGHLTPVAWGMDGLKNILIRGQGLESVWLPAGALLGFAVLWFTLAVWRFEFE